MILDIREYAMQTEGRHHLTPEQIARRFQVPRATVYQWRTKGYGPVGIRVGRHVRYRLEDVERWEQEQLAGGQR